MLVVVMDLCLDFEKPLCKEVVVIPWLDILEQNASALRSDKVYMQAVFQAVLGQHTCLGRRGC